MVLPFSACSSCLQAGVSWTGPMGCLISWCSKGPSGTEVERIRAKPKGIQDKQLRDGCWSEGWARSSESSQKKGVVGVWVEWVRNSWPEHVHTKKVKPGTRVAGPGKETGEQKRGAL